MENTIENGYLKVKIKSKGAELFSINNKETDLEYMWSGDPAFWGKTSPVLFPIVGTLKQNLFIYRGEPFPLTRHGFAREETFSISSNTSDEIVYTLTNNADTLIKYPFHFRLSIRYRLSGHWLEVTYFVDNTGKDEMLFSIGGHPAFKVPLTPDSRYEEHYLEFNKIENSPRWPISADGLIEATPLNLLKDTNRLQLTRDLFKQDALVFKHLQSNMVSLRSPVHAHGLDFDFTGFPYLGIWAAKNADFVCIEPWCGIADAVSHNMHFDQKEGIEKIRPNEQWSRTWRVKCY